MVTEPRISANKLAEYLIRRAAKQRAILEERKYPDPEFNMGIYHRESLEAVSKFLADGAVDTSALTAQLQILAQQNPEKIGTARRVNANIDALRKFEGMLDSVSLHGAVPELGAQNPPPITYYGVRISVRPEIILRGTGPKGKKYIGGIKLSMSTGFVHTDESAGYVSAMVQEYLRQNLVTDEIVNGEYCQVIDVGGERIFPGVKSTLQRLRDVEAECRNIAALWPSI